MNKSDYPYPGLRPFNEHEADIFFGREEQIDQLLHKLEKSQFVGVVGVSGCGKSSLVQAGIVPKLRAGLQTTHGSAWRIATMVPGEHPLRSLADALVQQSVVETGGDPKSRSHIATFVAATLRRGSLGLHEVLKEFSFPEHTNLLILIDQFEEVFRVSKVCNEEQARAFVALLLASVEQSPIHVLLTMRSDFLGNCAFFPKLPEKLNDSQFLTPKLTRGQCRAAIVGPADVCGGIIVEPRLVNHLLNEIGPEVAQLPVLQHCLMRMWDKAIKRAGFDRATIQPRISSGESIKPEIQITMADYEAVGELEKALTKHAEEAYEPLDTTQKWIAECLFRCLSERDGERDTKRPASVKDVANVANNGISEKDVMAVIKGFNDDQRNFLVWRDKELQHDSLVNLSHESLIRQWQRLNKWAEQEVDSAETYKHLEKTAILWEKEKAALWGTPGLEHALAWRKKEKPTPEWAKRYGDQFDLAMKFLNSSEQAQAKKYQREEIERQGKLKRTKHLLLAVFIGFLIASALAGWALWERVNAEKARAKTEVALKQAEKAQKNAEQNSSCFEELTNATFGFLAKANATKTFITWVEENSSIERLVPALSLMVELSEVIPSAQKEFWQNALPNMTEAERLELLDILGKESARKTSSNGTGSYIPEISIMDENGQSIPFNDELLTLKPLQKAIFNIENEDSAYNFDIRLWSLGGEIEAQTVYRAPEISGSKGIIRIEIIENNTEKIVYRKVIKIDIQN